MAKRAAGKTKPVWERGYYSHGYWRGKAKLGMVVLGPKGKWDGVYRWQAGTLSGDASSLADAKRQVEAAVLLGTTQLPLFDK